MDHHRTAAPVLVVHVLEFEALGLLEVELHRAELPRAPQRVPNTEIDLRTVKGTIARVDLVLEALFLEGGFERSFGPVPGRYFTEKALGTGTDLDLDLFEAEGLVALENHGRDRDDLGFDLILAAKDVGIVLAEAAYPREPVGGTCALIPVQATEIGHADRELAVAVPRAPEQHAVARAVHGLDPVLALVDLAREHVVDVVVVVTAASKKLHVEDLGRDDLLVAVLVEQAANVGLERVVD